MAKFRLVLACEGDRSDFPNGMVKGSHIDDGNATYEVLEIVPQADGRMMVVADWNQAVKSNLKELYSP
jgi:hypothetical protein